MSDTPDLGGPDLSDLFRQAQEMQAQLMEAQADLRRGDASDSHGTTITFLPDDEIFDELEFDYATLAERLRETAFLTRGLKIELVDERGAGQKDTFHYEGGIVDFVAHLNENKDPLHRKTVFFDSGMK